MVDFFFALFPKVFFQDTFQTLVIKSPWRQRYFGFIFSINFIAMQEPMPLNNVAEFHRTFRHPVLQKPLIPAEDRCQLRLNLLEEELKELQDAVGQGNIVAVADALCDLQYVLSGAVLEFGLGPKFKELFDEVQRSNMSKACRTKHEAETTVRHYEEVHNVECYYREENGKYLVYRSSDNKTMKSINYSPANLEKIVKGAEVEVAETALYFG
jgi:predicted HAD superfamily Cof-like phosphohydrolase